VQIAKFLEGPSLGELAAYVVAQLDGSAISPAVHGAATAKNTWEEGVV
jgi:hypothetical protein